MVEEVSAGDIIPPEPTEQPEPEPLKSDLYTTEGNFPRVSNLTTTTYKGYYNTYQVWKDGKEIRFITSKLSTRYSDLEGNLTPTELKELIDNSTLSEPVEDWHGYTLITIT